MALDPKKDFPQVSLIIPTYNREEELCETLRCALAQTYRPLEIVVIDQSPAHTAGTRAFLQQVAEHIRYVHCLTPSVPLAYNTGVESAGGEVIVFVDDDVTFGPEFVENHVAYYRGEPTLAGVAGHITADAPAVPYRPTGFYATQAGAGNMSCRRSVVLEVGGFDPRFSGNAVGVEIDFVRRLRRRGYRLANGERAVLHHLRAAAGGTRGEPTRWLEDYFRNTAFGFAKRFPGGAWLLPLFVLKNFGVYWRHFSASAEKRAFLKLLWKSHGDAVRLLRQPVPASFLSAGNSSPHGR